ncbi:alpha/beta hydrolase [Paenibacillus sp. JTLBN-2024]
MKILIWIVSIIVFVVAGGLLAINLSPVPFVLWLRHQPDPGPSAPAGWADYEKLAEVHKDLEYPSAFKSNTLDIYLPKNTREKLPTILWVHGGAFVAGDKSGTSYWCTMMAGKGYAVVSMNYELAPEAKYPAPILQMGEAYEYLKSISPQFPSLDLNRLIIGGGGGRFCRRQIASQFAAIQTNPGLAGRVGIDPTVPAGTLKAALLYCGPYNVKHLANVTGNMERFFLQRLGWAYIGKRNWQERSEAEDTSTANHVTRDFPPTFITDGNSGSFEKHGKELEAKLRAANVPVTALFYPPARGVVSHEYQFQTAYAGGHGVF